MHRSVVVLLLALMISVPLLGQHVLELEELHLASWENIPGAGPDATGPVSGAIVIAWHAEHGYARLLPDLNGDGRVDREDTIELGARFLEPMRAFEGPVSDPMLVDVLAHYVAGRYPDTFELLIYDSSFPEEQLQKHRGRVGYNARNPSVDVRLPLKIIRVGNKDNFLAGYPLFKFVWTSAERLS